MYPLLGWLTSIAIPIQSCANWPSFTCVSNEGHVLDKLQTSPFPRDVLNAFDATPWEEDWKYCRRCGIPPRDENNSWTATKPCRYSTSRTPVGDATIRRLPIWAVRLGEIPRKMFCSHVTRWGIWRNGCKDVLQSIWNFCLKLPTNKIYLLNEPPGP